MEVLAGAAERNLIRTGHAEVSGLNESGPVRARQRDFFRLRAAHCSPLLSEPQAELSETQAEAKVADVLFDLGVFQFELHHA